MEHFLTLKKTTHSRVIFIGKCEDSVTTKLFLLTEKNLKRCQIHFLSEQELRPADAF